jgi:hypothetical protein
MLYDGIFLLSHGYYFGGSSDPEALRYSLFYA